MIVPRLRVHEIFQSVPDYGPFAGQAATFVVLSRGWVLMRRGELGDGPWSGPMLDVAEVVKTIPDEPSQVVLMNVSRHSDPAFITLVESLVSQFTVCIEVGPENIFEKLADAVFRVVDILPPSHADFREPAPNLWSRLRSTDRIRFSVSSENDARWVNSVCSANGLWNRLEIDIVPIGPLSALEWIQFPGVDSTMNPSAIGSGEPR